MINLSVILLNWNRPKDTIECIRSLDKCSLSNNIHGTIVVVDNASSDDSVKQFQNLKVHNWDKEIVENDGNYGFAKGNNEGIKFALSHGADYLLILNNDTIVDKDLIVNILATYQSDSDIGILTPKIYFAPGFEFKKEKYSKHDLGKVIWYAGGSIDWNNVYGNTNGIDEVDHGQFDIKRETDFATGACLLASREVMEKSKGFDEKYFMYYEDTDLSQRVKTLGMKVVYDPSGILWHKVAQSSGIGSNLNDYFITRNRLLFGLRYAPLRAKIALIRESIKFLFYGRTWQKIGVRDFYLQKFEKGSWK